MCSLRSILLITFLSIVSSSESEQRPQKLYSVEELKQKDPAGASWAYYRFPPNLGYHKNYEHNLIWKQVEPGSVYAASQFWFQQGQGGYIGGQFWQDGRNLLNYAIWDINDDVMTAFPIGENCQRFGGEGEGAQCQLFTKFELDRTYTFRVEFLRTNGTGDFWRGSARDTVTGEVTVLGDIYLLNWDGLSGYGNLQANCLTFQEYFLAYKNFYSSFCWEGPWFNRGQIPPLNGYGRTQHEHRVLGGCPGTVANRTSPYVFFEAGPGLIEKFDDPLWLP